MRICATCALVSCGCDLCKALETDIAEMFGNIPVSVRQLLAASAPDEMVIQVCQEGDVVRWSFTFQLSQAPHFSNEEYQAMSERVLFAMWKDLHDDLDDEDSEP